MTRKNHQQILRQYRREDGPSLLTGRLSEEDYAENGEKVIVPATGTKVAGKASVAVGAGDLFDRPA